MAISITTSIAPGAASGTITVAGIKSLGSGVFDIDLDTDAAGDDDQTVSFSANQTPIALATAIVNSWSNSDSTVTRVGAVVTITCNAGNTITQLDVSAAEIAKINLAPPAAPSAPAAPAASAPLTPSDYLVPLTQPSCKPALVATTKAEAGGGFYITGEGTGDV